LNSLNLVNVSESLCGCGNSTVKIVPGILVKRSGKQLEK
jgi:hypothetical protein